MIRILTAALVLFCIACSPKSSENSPQFYQGIAQTGKPGTDQFSADTFFVNLTKNGTEYIGETTYKMEHGEILTLKGTKSFKDKSLILYAYASGKQTGSALFSLKKSGKSWKGFASAAPYPNWASDTLISVTLTPYTLSKSEILKKAEGTYHLSEIEGVTAHSSDFSLFLIDSSWYGSMTQIEKNGVREGYAPQFTQKDRSTLESCRIEVSAPNRVHCILGNSTQLSEISDSLSFFKNQLAIADFDTVDLALLLELSAVNLPTKGKLHITYLYNAGEFTLTHTTADGSITRLIFQKNPK